MTIATYLGSIALISFVGAVAAAQTHVSNVTSVQPGHWLEVRGGLNADGEFVAERAEIVSPQKYVELIGSVAGSDRDARQFLINGIRVKTSRKTDYRDVDSEGLSGRRLKVEGYYRGYGNVSSRKVSARGGGRDRLVGRVEQVAEVAHGRQFTILGIAVLVALDVPVGHELPLERIFRDERQLLPDTVNAQDDDDLFGEGIRLSDKVSLTLQVEGRTTREDNFDLDDEDAEDRVDRQVGLRARLDAVVSPTVSARLDVRHQQLFRDDDEDGRFSRGESRVGEAYAFFRELAYGVDLQIGRQDFDDPREWLFDENLDGARAYWSGKGMKAQVSLSTTLFDGTARERSARNTIVYVSNNDSNRYLAAYLIDRRFDHDGSERRTHVGVRALGEWLPGFDGWLEFAHMTGREAGVRGSGFAVDVGLTRQFGRWMNLTLGFASAEGGGTVEGGVEIERGFRQTDLQDNNGKFAGTTSFRYYGELLDPELSNLQVMTAGFGINWRRRASLDLIAHYYRQDRARDWLVDTDLDRNPNGISTDLGFEIDAVVGWRPSERWDLEAVAGYFRPGDAFDTQDASKLLKLQLRYRY